jgi:hypothetical protein
MLARAVAPHHAIKFINNMHRRRKRHDLHYTLRRRSLLNGRNRGRLYLRRGGHLNISIFDAFGLAIYGVPPKISQNKN